MKKLTLISAAALGLLMLPGCSSGGVDLPRLLRAGIIASKAATLSDEEVAQYVAQYVEYLDANSDVLPPGNRYSLRLQRIVGGMESIDGTPLNFKVYLTDDINAFACADGSVRVFSGLMDIMTDEELRGVIGHELGHVANHDSRDAFKNVLLSEAIREGLGSTNGMVADLSDSTLGDVAQSMFSARYSRSQEEEADQYACEYLAARGYNPGAYADALRKLDAIEQQHGDTSELSQLFSSHPDTRKRIDRIEAYCAENGYCSR